MNVRMDDNCPHRFWVSSESDGDKEYCVELGRFPLGFSDQGAMIFNGACMATTDPNLSSDGPCMVGCRNFLYRCEPMLRKPENMGKVFRCKHIRAAREHALDLIIPFLVKADPNTPNESQV